jgi:anti-sigma regulatory factor (Ser/Thr protein kinase)
MPLAVNEACVNVIQHARGSQPDGRVPLLVCRRRNVLVSRLQDQAPIVDVTGVPPRAIDDMRPGGFGVHMIRELMDKVEFLHNPERVGNLSQMTEYLTC